MCTCRGAKGFENTVNWDWRFNLGSCVLSLPQKKYVSTKHFLRSSSIKFIIFSKISVKKMCEPIGVKDDYFLYV